MITASAVEGEAVVFAATAAACVALLAGEPAETRHCLRSVAVPTTSGKQCVLTIPRKQWHTRWLSPPGRLAPTHRVDDYGHVNVE
jgi:hypothetical protein